MTHFQPGKLFLGVILMLAIATGLSSHAAAEEAHAFSVSIEQIPPAGGGPDGMAMIAGKARGATPTEVRVVIFAHTDMWYVQPYVAAPHTAISKSGKWRSLTHLGYEYAALVVKPSYRPPATTFALPAVGNDVLAIDVVPASDR